LYWWFLVYRMGAPDELDLSIHSATLLCKSMSGNRSIQYLQFSHASSLFVICSLAWYHAAWDFWVVVKKLNQLIIDAMPRRHMIGTESNYHWHLSSTAIKGNPSTAAKTRLEAFWTYKPLLMMFPSRGAQIDA
jgi:hypothetical protein